MRKNNSSSQNSANVPSGAVECDVSTDKKAAKALANATEKYAHVVPGAIWRDADGKHLRVLILCTDPGCTSKRSVFTSDCFQVTTCADHKKSATKPIAPKAEKAPRKGARSKDAPKVTKKARGEKKGNRKAPRGKRTAAKSDTSRTPATEEVR